MKPLYVTVLMRGQLRYVKFLGKIMPVCGLGLQTSAEANI